MDPFADDPDFQFLCVDRKKLMAEQTKPFDGKKNCWIPDEKDGYIKAEIQATKGEDVTVLTENMEVSWNAIRRFYLPNFEVVIFNMEFYYINVFV